MDHMYADVALFHKVFGAITHEVPTQPSPERIALRRSLIAEETSEMWKGLIERDMVETADGLADTLYVLVGTLLEYGLALAPLYAKVVPNGPPGFPDLRRIYEIRGQFAINQAILWRSDRLENIRYHLNDIINDYVALANELHLPLFDLWAEVQRSNMKKLHRPSHLECSIGPSTRCTCGAVLYREDGKILKPEGWKPPDIEGLLERHGYVPLKKRPVVPPYEPNKS